MTKPNCAAVHLGKSEMTRSAVTVASKVSSARVMDRSMTWLLLSAVEAQHHTGRVTQHTGLVLKLVLLTEQMQLYLYRKGLIYFLVKLQNLLCCFHNNYTSTFVFVINIFM